jgi:hypothetical protein
VSHALDSRSLVAGRPGTARQPGGGRVGKLVEMLGTIADPRKPRGLGHQIGAVLAVTVFAVLAGGVTSERPAIGPRISRRNCWRWPGVGRTP